MPSRSRLGRIRRALRTRASALALVAFLVAGSMAPAAADEYDPEYAGHPLRIVAYALHPVGVLIDYLFMRPAHWIVSHEPMRTIFGHQEPK